ncbi:MAG: RnfABCDGE type electron transport complex subunit D, partial [Nitrososphaerales archaeon]|nr:RnfABCDGE type electron transport complex subunit D [Nitrososphaerales archaeon]
TFGFLTTYILLFTIFALYIGQEILVRLSLEVFGAGGGLFFFTFFMLTDPPTSPARNQTLYGLIVASIAFILRFLTNPIQFLLITLIVMNMLIRLIDTKVTRLNNLLKNLMRI